MSAETKQAVSAADLAWEVQKATGRDTDLMRGKHGGVYYIINTVTREIYIGATVNFRLRKISHFSSLRRRAHTNPRLQASWNKYGEENFVMKVLVKSPIVVDFTFFPDFDDEQYSDDETRLLNWLQSTEKYFIKKLKPAFNQRSSRQSISA